MLRFPTYRMSRIHALQSRAIDDDRGSDECEAHDRSRHAEGLQLACASDN